MFRPRRAQREVLQEVLIVTLVNSAVDNFAARISRFLREEYKLLRGVGYRVRTLHGLSHDIVRERPSIVGLADDFAIADEREAGDILNDAVRAWLRSHPELQEAYWSPDTRESEMGRVTRKWWPEHMTKAARAFMRVAKDRQWTPEAVRSWLQSGDFNVALARFCVDVYADYQRSLSYRGKVDFDDLVVHAISALRLDSDYLERLRQRWPFILEDEAQDSSRLQQDLLALLSGPNGRWVRVGDPNQAVFYTFTTANPRLLRDFLDRDDVRTVEMPESGRSACPIIDVANYLVDWAVNDHPVQTARSAFRRQHILPTGSGDPQPNPSDGECRIHLYARKLTPEAELRTVVSSLSEWVPEHEECTVAVLVPDNNRGFRFAEALKKRGLAVVELLNSTAPTRETAGILEALLKHLADPCSARRLKEAFLACFWQERADPQRGAYFGRLAARLQRCSQPEDYLWPRLGIDWLREQDLSDDAEGRQYLLEFRERARRWHKAAGLPIDQLILTLGQDLFEEPGDLARAYHFAVVLRSYNDANPRWRLEEWANELDQIARNARRFVGLSAEDTGFDPDRHKGKVVVATMHKAKGLEWDRVHLTAVNNYDFPSGAELDRYRGEPWYVRDDLNLEAEALGQLEALGPGRPAYVEGEASQQARADYVSERLRLLYVGITRAKRELIVTWNTGKSASSPKQPALAFTQLCTFWEQREEREKAENVTA